MSLDDMVSLTVILTFLGGLFSYTVLRPLNKAIQELRSLVLHIQDRLDEDREEWHKLRERMAVAEQSLKRLHERLDSIEKLVGKFAHFCYETHKKDNLDCTDVIDVMSGCGGERK